MASGEVSVIQSGENFDDLLKCNICLETLKEPKLLPCLHTFCKSCISSYFESSKKRKDEIPCPVCRQPVPLIGGSDDVEAFVEKLPKNNFAVSLLNKASLDKPGKFCDPCKFDGIEVTAISWCGICDEALCRQCEKCHRKFKATSDHEVIPITDLGKKGDGANISKVIFCGDHQKSAVQVYCVDHRKACCTLCATLSHRKCEKVISIEEAASGIKEKPEVSELLKQMDENLKLLTGVINCREENEASIDTEATNIETTVTKMVKEMKDHLDRIQNKILTELEASKKQTSMKVTDDINEFTSYKSAITNWKNMLSGVVKHGTDQQCLVILNEIAPKIGKLQNEIKHNLEKIRNSSFRFEITKDVKYFEHTMQSIGDFNIDELKVKYVKNSFKGIKADFQNGSIVVVRTINVAQSGKISGVFLDDLLIFAAYDTKKVVKYNRNGEQMGELSVSSAPTDLCEMSNARVVVSCWSPSELYVVDCQNMTLLRTMRLSNIPVWGICVYDDDQFLIGSWEKSQLTWIDRSSGKW